MSHDDLVNDVRRYVSNHAGGNGLVDVDVAVAIAVDVTIKQLAKMADEWPDELEVTVPGENNNYTGNAGTVTAEWLRKQ